VNIAGEGTLRTAAFWQSMIADGLVAGVNHGTQDWIAAMHDGGLWGLLGASWSVGSLNRSIPKDTGRWAVTTMPTWDGVPANGIQGGTAFGVSAESEVPEAATAFLRWLSTNPEVPRIGARISTPFPASLANREVAKSAYKGGYFLGEPVYDVLEEAAGRVPEWTWGPNALRLFSTVVDNVGGVRTGGTTLPEAVRRVQAAAVADMRARGLSVAEGGRA
jgi:multiple sugar transport system substrate-binding protein